MVTKKDIWIDTSEFGRAMIAIEGDLRDGNRNRHLRAYRKWLKKEMVKRFDVGGVSQSGATGVWKPRVKTFRKNKSTHPILVKTGAMRKAQKVGVKNKGWTITQNNTAKSASGFKYAFVHQFGFSKNEKRQDGTTVVVVIPKREIILFTDAEIEELKESLVRWHIQTFKEAGAGS